jgi:hypothetical protein
MMKVNLRVLSAVLVLTMATTAGALSQQRPTLDGALAWLKKLDGEYAKPRFAELTVEKLRTLSELKLGGHRKSDNKHVAIDPNELRFVTVLPALTKLSLGEVDGLTDASMDYVGQVSGLLELDLSDAAITDAGLRRIGDLKELRLLNLAFARQIGDAGMEHVGKLTNLETLMLSGTKVTDAGLKSLAKLTKLKELRLGGQMEIGDAGLVALEENKALTKLIVGKKSKVTDAGIAALKAKLPALVIEKR